MIARDTNREGMNTRAGIEALGALVLALLALAFALRSPVPNPGTPSGNGATRMALGCSTYSQGAT